MKKLLYFLLAAASCGTVAEAQEEPFFSCDFSSGIPEDFVLIDNDCGMPSENAARYGFKMGLAWIACSLDNNMVAASTSNYKPAVSRTDDWMITPGIKIDENADEVLLSWLASSASGNSPDGYSVYISTTGGKKISDFDKSAPVFSITAEKNQWMRRAVDLSEYKGQTVYVAFVNDSRWQGTLLYIDDIWVGQRNFSKLNSVKNQTDHYVSKPLVTVEGKFVTSPLVDEDGYTTELILDGESFTEQHDVKLQAESEYEFSLGKKISIAKGETKYYTLILTAGGESYEMQGVVTFPADNDFEYRFMAEELTGTWCVNCPRGIVVMEELERTYGERFIPVSVHGDDIMAIEQYPDFIYSFTQMGYPSATLNRKYSGDVNELKNYTMVLENKNAICDIDVYARFTDESRDKMYVETVSEYAFSSEKPSLRLGFVIVEDSVQGTTDDYDQRNGYAGGYGGVMGGFESLPDPVPATDMIYRHVARSLYGGMTGIEGSIPVVAEDEPLKAMYTIDVPQNVIDRDRLRVIAMVIDEGNSEIRNADISRVYSHDHVKSLEPVKKAMTDVRIFSAEDKVFVCSDSQSHYTEIMVTDMNGRIVRRLTAPEAAEGFSLDKGLYLIMLHGDNISMVRKFIHM